MLSQLLDDLCCSPVFEPLLLGLARPPGRLCPAAFGGIGQIFTDMVEVAQEVFLIAEDLATLEADPFRAIGDHMDLAVESPAGGFGAVCPSASDLLDFAEAGRVVALAATMSLGGDQAHFLPEARTFGFSFSGFHRADHRQLSASATTCSLPRTGSRRNASLYWASNFKRARSACFKVAVRAALGGISNP